MTTPVLRKSSKPYKNPPPPSSRGRKGLGELLLRAHRGGEDRLPIQFMCRMLGVSRSGYYDWGGRPPSARSREDGALTERIHEIHRRSRRTYGSPRVHAELRALGTRCSRKRVERLMRQAGLRGCMRGRGRGATRRCQRSAAAEDLVKRNFAATEVDKVWVADITYVATREGFLYLAFILDVHSRRIVGWAMEDHLRTELVVDALQMAVWRRKPAPALVHHPDRGVQYTALSFSERLREVGITPPMGRTGRPGKRYGRELRLNAEGGAGEHNGVPDQTGGQDGHLRVPGDLLQHPPSALGSRLHEPLNLRGG
jgi:putative transposase